MLVTAGAKIPVGAPIFISVDDESNIAAFTDYKVVSIASPTPSSPTPTPAPKPTPIVTAPPATKVSQIQETNEDGEALEAFYRENIGVSTSK